MLRQGLGKPGCVDDPREAARRYFRRPSPKKVRWRPRSASEPTSIKDRPRWQNTMSKARPRPATSSNATARNRHHHNSHNAASNNGSSSSPALDDDFHSFSLDGGIAELPSPLISWRPDWPGEQSIVYSLTEPPSKLGERAKELKHSATTTVGSEASKQTHEHGSASVPVRRKKKKKRKKKRPGPGPTVKTAAENVAPNQVVHRKPFGAPVLLSDEEQRQTEKRRQQTLQRHVCWGLCVCSRAAGDGQSRNHFFIHVIIIGGRNAPQFVGKSQKPCTNCSQNLAQNSQSITTSGTNPAKAF